MDNHQNAERGPDVRVVAGASTWIEGEAIRQLEETARLPGMIRAVGLPDLHPGKGSPIGAAFLSKGLIRPALVGSDVGCGMSLWHTDLAARRVRPDRLAERLDGLDAPWDGDAEGWLADRNLNPTGHEHALGTVGSGNHFAEFQAVSDVLDPDAFRAMGLDAERLMLLVHCGSRTLGESLWRKHAATHGVGALEDGTREAEAWLAEHDAAVRWAEANRDLVAARMAEAAGTQAERRFDICHNNVVEAVADGCRCWLHRKGAAPADKGPVVVPGSRGDVSILVAPVPDRDDALLSLAHGAGRKLTRADARSRMKDLYRRSELETNPFGGRVVCGDEGMLYEEAPEAYKDVRRVVGDLVDAGLAKAVAVLRPVVTFKSSSRRTHDRGKDSKAARMRDRKEARSFKHGRESGR
jgi:release factor H-coupled RctB family protein